MKTIPMRAPNWTSTPDRIYRAAISLFRRREYSEVTIDEIASVAKIGRRTFFNHFPTKEHILARFHQELTADCLTRAEDATAQDGWERILAAFDAFAAVVMAEPTLSQSLLRLVFVSDVLAGQDREDVLLLGDWLRRQLQAAVEQRVLCGNVDLEIAGSLLMGGLSSGTMQWLTAYPEVPGPLDRDFRLKLELLRKGMGA